MKSGTMTATLMNGRSSLATPILRRPRSENKTEARMAMLRIQMLASTGTPDLRNFSDVR
jgi:hypothetical protein